MTPALFNLSALIYGQTFVVRMGCLIPCRTFPQMTSRTLPARQPSSMTQSSLSGENPEGLAMIFLLFSRWFSMVCPSFSDAKKKLRLALCSADSVALPIMTPATTRNGLPDHMESEGGLPDLMLSSVLSLDCFYKIHLN